MGWTIPVKSLDAAVINAAGQTVTGTTIDYVEVKSEHGVQVNANYTDGNITVTLNLSLDGTNWFGQSVYASPVGGTPTGANVTETHVTGAPARYVQAVFKSAPGGAPADATATTWHTARA